jgi:hypothetical protein
MPFLHQSAPSCVSRARVGGDGGTGGGGGTGGIGNIGGGIGNSAARHVGGGGGIGNSAAGPVGGGGATATPAHHLQVAAGVRGGAAPRTPSALMEANAQGGRGGKGGSVVSTPQTGTISNAPITESSLMHTTRVGSYFALWYILNIAYNIFNKKVRRKA